ncbi:MAG TPA: hypothetical protein VEK07_02595 [Polyangiaceae bacterium]|nr:hypothetical protein [Polyangiaceae bacterium]
MRMLLATMVATSLIVIAVACRRQDDTQQPASAPAGTAPYGQYPGGYAPPPQGAYGQYPAAPYPTATYGAGQGAPLAPPPPAQAAPPPAVAAPPPAPAGSGQMAVPGPVAFQCQNDLPCGTHHCNVQYGKCAFPCQTNVDCITPNTCVMGLCVPAPPPQH